MELLIALSIGVLAGLLCAELQSWWPQLVASLVSRAVQYLPEPLRERYEQEWLAEIDDLPGPLSKLFNAIGLFRAAIIAGHLWESGGFRKSHKKESHSNDEPISARGSLNPVSELSMSPLSRRERECLQLTAAGKTVWEISQFLGIGEHTASAYIKSAMMKLNCVTKPQAVGRAVSLGLIDIR